MTEDGSGTHPTHDRRPLALVGVAVVGLITLGALAFWTQPVPAHAPFPSVPAQVCLPPASADKGGQTLTFDWQVAVETDRPQGSAILFVSGPDTLLCFVSRSDDGSPGGVITGLGGHGGDTRTGLTLDTGMGGPVQEPDILVGRIPTGTAVVRLGLGRWIGGVGVPRPRLLPRVTQRPSGAGPHRRTRRQWSSARAARGPERSPDPELSGGPPQAVEPPKGRFALDLKPTAAER